MSVRRKQPADTAGSIVTEMVRALGDITNVMGSMSPDTYDDGGSPRQKPHGNIAPPFAAWPQLENMQENRQENCFEDTDALGLVICATNDAPLSDGLDSEWTS